MVCQVGKLCLGVECTQGLDDMVFEDKSLVGSAVVLALGAVSDVAAVEQPCVVPVVGRHVGLGKSLHVAHHHLKAFLA